MAHTIDNDDYRDVWGTRYARRVKITIVDNYVTGGWPLTPAQLGFGIGGTIEALLPMNSAEYTPGIISWRQGALKLRANDWAGTEIANASAALAGLVYHFIAIGSGSPS